MRRKEQKTNFLILVRFSCVLIGKCKGLGNSLQAGHYVDKLSFQEKLFTIGTKVYMHHISRIHQTSSLNVQVVFPLSKKVATESHLSRRFSCEDSLRERVKAGW